MSQNYQDPNQQPGGYNPSMQPGYDPTQQQGQDPTQQASSDPMQQGQDPFSNAKQMAKQQIGQVIDQLANKIPGGQQLAQNAKDTIGGALDTLAKSVEQVAKERLSSTGGMFGRDQGN